MQIFDGKDMSVHNFNFVFKFPQSGETSSPKSEIFGEKFPNKNKTYQTCISQCK